MTEFWFLSLALLALALAFIFVPVCRYVKNENSLDRSGSADQSNSLDSALEEDRQRQNVLIFKERLVELEVEYAQGKHQEEAFIQLKAELEANLLIDTEAAAATTEKTNIAKGAGDSPTPALGIKNLLVIALSVVLVIVVSYGSYFKYGSYDAVIQTKAMQFDDQEIKQAKASAEQGDMIALLEQLHQKLLQAPDNIEGWRMLARSAMNTEKYALAVESYTQIIRIFDATDESTAAVYGLLAQATYYQNQGQFNLSVQSALDEAFKQNPNEVNSLGLMAINAFVQQEYAVAIESWQKILKAAPDHPSKISIESGIQRAQMFLGEAPVEDSQSSNTVARIQVEVSIAPDVLAKVSPQDTVFIFAKAAQGVGPAMPLAAKKLKVSDLPVSIELNDQSAMGPMAKLSQVQTVNVVARISKSGQPIAQPGDYEGRHESVEVFANESIQIEIAHEKK